MNSGSRSSYDSNLTDSLSSIKDGTGFLADTPGGSSSSTSMPEGAREAFAKKRFNSYSGLSYDSRRLNSAPDSLADDWDLEESGLEQVNVVARIRPLSEAEKKRGDKDCVKIQHNSSSVTLGNADKIKTFTFSAILDSQTTQREVLEKCGMMQMIEMAVDGYSCTAFAYGQTGSGKTYTITGPVSQDSVMPTEDKYGLIQRSFRHLFEVLKQKSSPSITFTLSASYLEIYNEQVKDLLNPSGRGSLPVRWSKEKGFYVENLFIVDCETLDDLLALLEEGMSQRQIATNNINEYSSRSHTIVSLQIDSEMPDPEESTLYITKHGRLSFVDLAGSEKVKELGNSGELLTETTNINKSLLTLGNCISALSDNRKRSGHIPYRDSKLTKLLADSLGGSGITLMIACITPSVYCLSESLSTLRYANRAKRIKNKPVIRMDPREKLILSLKREIKLLRNENIYLRQCLEFPRSDKPPTMRRNDTEQSLLRFNSDDSLSGDKTPIPEDFDRNKGKSDTSLKREEKRERTLSSFTPKSAADSSLYEMLQEYMVENEKLRSENSDLYNVRERAMTEHEHLSKENDKLLTKLDELERVFAASPISMSRTVSGVSSYSASQRIRSNSQDSNASPTSQQGQRAMGSGSSQGSAALLLSPDWQQGGRVDPAGGSGGIDRHKTGFDASSNLDQSGQLPPVDSKRGVPNGYRTSKSHPPLNAPGSYRHPSPPHAYRSHDPQQHSVNHHPPTHQSFPPSKNYHGQVSIKPKHEDDSASPRGLVKPRHSQLQANQHTATTGETTQARPQHNVDIYIPSIQPTANKAAKTDSTSPRWDSKAIKKPPSKTEGAKAAPLPAPAPSSQTVSGYSNRSKMNTWAQGKSGPNKPSPKTQHRDITDSASTEQNLDAIPHTPAATPPPVKYRPKGTSDLLAATSGHLTNPPPNQESLQEINEKLRQELLDLDGEIQYMKYVNKAKVNNNNTAATTKTGTKGKRR